MVISRTGFVSLLAFYILVVFHSYGCADSYVNFRLKRGLNQDRGWSKSPRNLGLQRWQSSLGKSTLTRIGRRIYRSLGSEELHEPTKSDLTKSGLKSAEALKSRLKSKEEHQPSTEGHHNDGDSASLKRLPVTLENNLQYSKEVGQHDEQAEHHVGVQRSEVWERQHNEVTEQHSIDPRPKHGEPHLSVYQQHAEDKLHLAKGKKTGFTFYDKQVEGVYWPKVRYAQEGPSGKQESSNPRGRAFLFRDNVQIDIDGVLESDLEFAKRTITERLNPRLNLKTQLTNGQHQQHGGGNDERPQQHTIDDSSETQSQDHHPVTLRVKCSSYHFPTRTFHTADEAYRLEVLSTMVIEISDCKSVLGLINAVSTLLMRLDCHHYACSLPFPLVVVDRPQYSYRSVMVDTSRSFLRVITLESILDLMSFVKLNVLHMHLTDSHAWSYEITGKYSFLHKLASYDQNVNVYSKKDIAHLVDYGQVRGIRIIPEVDGPAHAPAAIGDAYWSLSAAGNLAAKGRDEPPNSDKRRRANTLGKEFYTNLVSRFEAAFSNKKNGMPHVSHMSHLHRSSLSEGLSMMSDAITFHAAVPSSSADSRNANVFRASRASLSGGGTSLFAGGAPSSLSGAGAPSSFAETNVNATSSKETSATSSSQTSSSPSSEISDFLDLGLLVQCTGPGYQNPGWQKEPPGGQFALENPHTNLMLKEVFKQLKHDFCTAPAIHIGIDEVMWRCSCHYVPEKCGFQAPASTVTPWQDKTPKTVAYLKQQIGSYINMLSGVVHQTKSGNRGHHDRKHSGTASLPASDSGGNVTTPTAACNQTDPAQRQLRAENVGLLAANEELQLNKNTSISENTAAPKPLQSESAIAPKRKFCARRDGALAPMHIQMWQDSVLEYDVTLGKADNYILHLWNYSPAENPFAPRRIAKACETGVKLVHASWRNNYLDCGNAHWIIHGNNWCPYVSWWVVYKQAIGSDTPASCRGNFIGGSVHSWSEMIDDDTVVSAIFPRAFALAERLWSYGNIVVDESSKAGYFMSGQEPSVKSTGQQNSASTLSNTNQPNANPSNMVTNEVLDTHLFEGSSSWLARADALPKTTTAQEKETLLRDMGLKQWGNVLERLRVVGVNLKIIGRSSPDNGSGGAFNGRTSGRYDSETENIYHIGLIQPEYCRMNPEICNEFTAIQRDMSIKTQ